jgi:hypothetical protein
MHREGPVRIRQIVVDWLIQLGPVAEESRSAAHDFGVEIVDQRSRQIAARDEQVIDGQRNDRSAGVPSENIRVSTSRSSEMIWSRSIGAKTIMTFGDDDTVSTSSKSVSGTCRSSVILATIQRVTDPGGPA